MTPISTFSLVAKDPGSQDLGIVVASKFLAVGSVVPWVQAGVGAVATQSYANTSFATYALERLQQGEDMPRIVGEFAARDPEHQSRQYGIVATDGRSYSFTGSACHPWAGGRSGKNYAAQGNLLAGAAVVDALVETFLARSDLAFPERLLESLRAADTQGGDARGRQSAALYVARAGGGYAGFNDRYIDLRVDDHPTPVLELERLLGIHRLLFERPNPDALLPIVGEVQTRVLKVLQRSGTVLETWNNAAQAALDTLVGKENLEERFLRAGFIDPVALAFLERKFSE
ncbi:MAG: DUF1028 domain-containing protein [Deinococcales bacterium]